MSTYAPNKNVIYDYFRRLISKFFKILPMWENKEDTLKTYMDSLKIELTGCNSVIGELGDCADMLSMISILQYFIDHPDAKIDVVRREVFHAISLCDSVRAKCCEVIVA